MGVKPAEKITFLSPRKVKIYKVWLIVLGVTLLMFSAFLVYHIFIEREFFSITNLFLPGLLGYRLYQVYKDLKPIEFDLTSVYVTEDGFEIIVPLDNIKKVEIKSLGGVYQIVLFDRIQSGNVIYFMPSLIYPLDYKKQDAKVEKLRAYSWKARQNREAIPRNALTS